MNLVDDPWIPVTRTDGTTSTVGLAQALAQADQIRRVAAGSPLEDRAVERLLVAVCWRAGGRHHTRDYLDRWQDSFDLERFCQYEVRPAARSASTGLDRLVLDPAGWVPASLTPPQAPRQEPPVTTPVDAAG